MKKFLLFAYCALLIGAFASCGGSSDKESKETAEDAEPKTYVLTPQTTSITGPLGKAYEVLYREYKVKDGISPQITVELTLTDPSGFPSGFNANKVGTRYDKGDAQYAMLANFTIEYLDEDGNILDTREVNSSSYKDLMRLSKDESSSVSFYVPDRNIEEVKSFRIKSDYYPNEIKEKEKVKESESTSKADDDDLDEALEQAGKAAKAAGKMVETAGELMKGLNDLTK